MDGGDKVRSVVARYLDDVEFRNDVFSDKERALSTCHLDAETHGQFIEFEFAKLESFGGLITKTQHNFLYEHLPWTRHLLRTYRLDLTVFAAYRRELQFRPSRASTRAEKTKRFVTYFQAWLGGKSDHYPGLSDVLLHEYIVWEIGNEVSEPSGTPFRGPRLAATRCAVPAIRPGVKLAEFRYDPVRMIGRLEEGSLPRKSHRSRRRLVYWIDADQSQLRIAEPDGATWQVLRKIDGNRSLTSLYDELTSLSRSTLRSVIASAEASGLIQMVPRK